MFQRVGLTILDVPDAYEQLRGAPKEDRKTLWPINAQPRILKPNILTFGKKMEEEIYMSRVI